MANLILLMLAAGERERERECHKLGIAFGLVTALLYFTNYYSVPEVSELH
jgi:hypothetical protein